jgi:pimeloyl-ACP methyl ester carboxylesterase
MTDGTMVLVPGLDGTALLFYRQVPALARKFRVETFPLRDDPSCTMEELVAELDVRLAALGEPVILCGESFGGALSLSFALSHPEKLRGLVILNSFPYVRQRIPLRVGPPLLKLLPWGAMPLVRRFTESRLHSSHTRPEDLREFRQRTHGIARSGYIRRLEILQSYDIRDQLHRVAVPTLFLAADQDRLLRSVEEARFMASRVPNAAVRVLEGFGHVCMIHHDFDLLEHITLWLETSAERRPSSTELGTPSASA